MILRHKGVSFKIVKTAGLRTKQDRRRYRIQRMRIQEQLERKAEREFRKFFAQQGRKILKEISRASDTAGLIPKVERAIGSASEKKKAEKVLKKHYERSFKTVDKFLKSGVKKSYSPVQKVKQDSLLETAMRLFIEETTATQVVGITLETQERIKRIMQDSITDGLTLEELSDKIKSTYRGFTIKRAGVIARTETTLAANNGARASFESLAFEKPVKTWLADQRPDARRPEHYAKDEQTIGLYEKYEVDNPNGGVDLMDGPGDTSAPPEQVVNCVCVEAFDALDEDL